MSVTVAAGLGFVVLMLGSTLIASDFVVGVDIEGLGRSRKVGVGFPVQLIAAQYRGAGDFNALGTEAWDVTVFAAVARTLTTPVPLRVPTKAVIVENRGGGNLDLFGVVVVAIGVRVLSFGGVRRTLPAVIVIRWEHVVLRLAVRVGVFW